MCSFNLFSAGIPDAISSANSGIIYMTIANAISETIPNSIPESISESNPAHSHCSTLLQERAPRQRLCEAAGEHLRSRYVAEVNISMSSDICCKIVLGCNVCNCSSIVDSVLDARD